MMFVKFQHGLGYESLCREVADSISWRNFRQLNPDVAVSAPSALYTITTPGVLGTRSRLNEALLAGRTCRSW